VLDRIKDRVAIVTGASRGIGWHIARLMHARGASVVLAARDEERLNALAAQLGDRVLVVPCDVADRAQVTALIDKTIERFGRIELLINNAGVGLSGTIADFALDDLEHVFAVNVFGAVACIQGVVPHMRKRRFGHIVNVSSILGKVSVPQTAGYAASKHALQAISDGLRVEEMPHGIAVTTVCPGSTDTEFRDNELHSGSVLLNERPRINLMTAERAAELTLRAIDRKSREVILTPFAKFLNVVGGVAPRALDVILERKYHQS